MHYSVAWKRMLWDCQKEHTRLLRFVLRDVWKSQRSVENKMILHKFSICCKDHSIWIVSSKLWLIGWSTLVHLKYSSCLLMSVLLNFVFHSLVIFQLKSRKGPQLLYCCGLCYWNFLKGPEQRETGPASVVFLNRGDRTSRIISHVSKMYETSCVSLQFII